MTVQVGNPSFLYEEMLDDYDDTNADPELKSIQDEKVFSREKGQVIPKHKATRSVSAFSLVEMLVHPRVTPCIRVDSTHFIHLGGERHRESRLCCPRTEHNVPGQGAVSRKPGNFSGP